MFGLSGAGESETLRPCQSVVGRGRSHTQLDHYQLYESYPFLLLEALGPLGLFDFVLHALATQA